MEIAFLKWTDFRGSNRPKKQVFVWHWKPASICAVVEAFKSLATAKFTAQMRKNGCCLGVDLLLPLGFKSYGFSLFWVYN
jgi:hypothetical protein